MYENSEVLFGGESRLLSLVSLIYEAVEQPGLWASVMDQVAESVRSGCTCLIAESNQCANGFLLALARTDPSYLESYARYYASINVLNDGCDRLFPNGTVRYSHIAVPDHEFVKAEFYADYFRPEGYFYSFGIKIPMAGQKPAYLVCVWPHDKGAYETAEGAVLTYLKPHLQRALGLHFHFATMRTNLEIALDWLPYGLITLDAQSRCVLANREAKRILDRRGGIYLDRGQLRASSAGETARFRAAIGRATQRDVGHVTTGMEAMPISAMWSGHCR